MCVCGHRVLSVGSPPFLVDELPHPLGIWTGEGRRLSVRDIAAAGTGHRAYGRHQCPVTEDTGAALFGVVE